MNLFHFDDLKADQATNRAAPFGNTFSYTLNLTSCLASYGLTLNATENRPFAFWAASRPPTGKPVNSTSLVNLHRLP